jgi:hypothetical protein
MWTMSPVEVAIIIACRRRGRAARSATAGACSKIMFSAGRSLSPPVLRACRIVAL